MHRFLELFTVAAFLATAAHAVWLRRRRGAVLFAAMLWLGLVREGFVVVGRLLYEIDEGALAVGPTPLIAGVIWGFSIYAALVFAEEVAGRDLLATGGPAPGAALFLLAGVFMVALAGFYEPFLGRVGLARWEAGTRTSFGVPWIALIGYPSLALPLLALFRWIDRRLGLGLAGLVTLTAAVTALAVLHAWGLEELKRLLEW